MLKLLYVNMLKLVCLKIYYIFILFSCSKSGPKVSSIPYKKNCYVFGSLKRYIFKINISFFKR